MTARQVTFTASEMVQDIIKDANIPKHKQSAWINQKIINAVNSEKPKQVIPGEVILID